MVRVTGNRRTVSISRAGSKKRVVMDGRESRSSSEPHKGTEAVLNNRLAAGWRTDRQWMFKGKKEDRRGGSKAKKRHRDSCLSRPREVGERRCEVVPHTNKQGCY